MIPPKSLYCPNTILILVRGEILFQIQICPISILSSNVMFYGIAAAPGNKLRFPKCWRWRSCGRPLIVIWLFLDITILYWGDLLRSMPFVTVWKIGFRGLWRVPRWYWWIFVDIITKSYHHITTSSFQHIQNPRAKNKLRHIFFTHRWELLQCDAWI